MATNVTSLREQRSRVLLVDDHAPMLSHVAQLVEKEFAVVGLIRDVDTLIETWPAAEPDVVVLDISLPRGNGFEAAVRLRHGGCHAAIVFLSVHEEPEIVRASWVAGGLGYVAKRDVGVDLLPAIRAALRGERFLSTAMTRH